MLCGLENGVKGKACLSNSSPLQSEAFNHVLGTFNSTVTLDSYEYF